jgi:hypothetical protein
MEDSNQNNPSQQPSMQQPHIQETSYQPQNAYTGSSQPTYPQQNGYGQQPVYQQPVYPQPIPQSPITYDPDAPLSMGQFLGMMLLTCIPVVGLVLLLVWAFSGSSNENKKNFARAELIMAIIVTVLWLILGSAIYAGIMGMMHTFY